jgi:hypothetical protein
MTDALETIDKPTPPPAENLFEGQDAARKAAEELTQPEDEPEQCSFNQRPRFFNS